MAIITGVTTERGISSPNLTNGPPGRVWVRVVSFSAYRIDGGPVIDENLHAKWSFDSQEEADRSEPHEAFGEAVVRLEAFKPTEFNSWNCAGFLGVVDDDSELDDRVEALQKTSPAVFPSDEYVLNGSVELIPDAKRVRPFDVAGAGTMTPNYSRTRAGHFRLFEFVSEPFGLDAFDGHQVRLVCDRPWSDQDTELIERALTQLIAAGPELKEAAAVKLLALYHFSREVYPTGDCIRLGIPLTLDEDDVWNHVFLRPDIYVLVEPPADSDPAAARVWFTCDCTWDDHSFSLGYRDGNQDPRAKP